MEKKFQELSERIDAYFSETSDERLRLDLEKAGYEFYKHINMQIFNDCVSAEEFTFSVKGIASKPTHGDKKLIFEDLFVPDSYHFNFKIAA
jgi:hypothetical protein